MEHPFKLTEQSLAFSELLSVQQTANVAGGSTSNKKPEYFTTLAHGEEGGMPEDPDM
jgi:hypothetical protein